jgi:hypothetical protein
MEDRNTLYLDTQGRVNKQSSGLDPLVIFNLLKRNWYWLCYHDCFYILLCKVLI